MIRDLQAILEICRDADDSRTALAQTASRVRARLDAAAVLLHAVPSGQRLACAGGDRGEGWRIASQAIECGGVVAAQDPVDGVPCAAANVRFAGQLLDFLLDPGRVTPHSPPKVLVVVFFATSGTLYYDPAALKTWGIVPGCLA